MKDPALHSYLKDHLAGSVAALELLDHLRGGVAPTEARQFLTTLRQEIEEEQQVLQRLLGDLGGTESRLREAGAWVGGKLSELKLKVEDSTGTGLRYFEALEALTLGIRGKLALWTALESVRDRIPLLGAIDFDKFIERSRDQYARVETRRVAAAQHALTTP